MLFRSKKYEWVENYEPWNFDVAEAPQWFTVEIDTLAREFGGSTSTGPRTRTDAPDASFNAFGKQVDNREQYARDLVWSIMVDLRREAPIPPATKELTEEFEKTFAIYEARVKSRLPPRRGATNADLLEEEGRGRSMLKEKWDAAFRQWFSKVSEAAVLSAENRVKAVEATTLVTHLRAVRGDVHVAFEGVEDFDVMAARARCLDQALMGIEPRIARQHGELHDTAPDGKAVSRLTIGDNHARPHIAEISLNINGILMFSTPSKVRRGAASFSF